MRSRLRRGSSLPIEDLSKRAVAFGMHTIVVDGQDVEEVTRPLAGSQARARRQGTRVPAREHVRLTGHYVGDPQVYRPREEVLELRQTQDPIEKLVRRSRSPRTEWDEFEREVAERVEASVEFAQNGTDPRPEDALKNVYA